MEHDCIGQPSRHEITTDPIIMNPEHRKYCVGMDEMFMARYPLKVALIGSGNWGSTIARIVGDNVCTNWRFQNEIKMHVFEEWFQDRKLSDWINNSHENGKYLPGYKLPANIVACTDIDKVVKDTDILILVLPHQYVKQTCRAAKPHIKKSAFALSLIKGFVTGKDDKITLVSDQVHSILNIPCDVLMGANIAKEVADRHFCEATLGTSCNLRGILLKSLLRNERLRINVVDDKDGVEICGAVKNVISIAAGILKGMGYGASTIAALVRLAMIEMITLLRCMSKTFAIETIFESCGLADILASADGGRNSRVASVFAATGRSWESLEREILGGQKLQGVQTASMINTYIISNGLESKFRVITTIHQICALEQPLEKLIEVLGVASKAGVYSVTNDPVYQGTVRQSFV